MPTGAEHASGPAQLIQVLRSRGYGRG